jgi:hypothetical protein
VATPVEYVRFQMNRDPHAMLDGDNKVTTQATQATDVIAQRGDMSDIVDMHKNCERHDPHTEELFKYVQVFTAIVDSFRYVICHR